MLFINNDKEKTITILDVFKNILCYLLIPRTLYLNATLSQFKNILCYLLIDIKKLNDFTVTKFKNILCYLLIL
ncbi:hypothetical protein CBC3_p0018 (plasmid) [Clostridium botulinum V891]|nr:hypothetical protein CBC3_p0018 [Clostridium botulinum V891]